MKTRDIAEIGLLAVFIIVTGMFKLPSFIPGTEFQLSAPIAVAICAVFGFKKYIVAGVIASLIGLILGTQNFFNVIIALVFRVSVGGVLYLGGRNLFTIIIAGPIGSILGRLCVGTILGKAVYPLIIASVPGLIFTAVTAYPLTKVLEKVAKLAKLEQSVEKTI